MPAPPRILLLVSGCISMFPVASSADEVDVDARICQAQLAALLRPDVDCVVEIRAGKNALGSAPQVLQTMLSGAACRVPLKFRKSQVYGEWITDNAAKFPLFLVNCGLSSGAQSDQFSASVRIDCTRSGDAWACVPLLQDVKGLGILGRQLENYVSNDAGIRAALTKALMPPERK